MRLVSNGIAFGFILYLILKIATGRWREVSPTLFVIAGLFLANFVFHYVS
jgi:AGZA family xanthine/uracil permease-like MFS transporter